MKKFLTSFILLLCLSSLIANPSVLSDGNIYKIAVSQSGVHKITYDFLKDKLKIDVNNLDPKKIQLFGNGGGMLPERINAFRYDDLEENEIFVSGEADGRFDGEDYILFYGEGPDKMYYDASDSRFSIRKNIYDEKTYYFLKIGIDDGARVQTQNSIPNTEYTCVSFNDVMRYEDDRANLLHDWTQAQGSGKKWFGDHFKVVREYDYSAQFVFPNIISSEPASVQVEFAGRYEDGNTRFNVTADGQTFTSNSMGKVGGSNESSYATIGKINADFNPSGDDTKLKVTYPSAGDSEGWLDYIEINARRELRMAGDQMRFRDLQTLGKNTSTFKLSNANNSITIWDISDPLKPKLQEVELVDSEIQFGTTTVEMREFIAFNGQLLLSPEAIGSIENQNLHDLNDVDMVLIYPQELEAEAQMLAEHRSDFDGLEIALVRIDQIFNEFSSGSLDPTAIRDFAKMLYDRIPQFRYMLLFGDGSFDYKDKYEFGNNHIPVYEADSLNPIYAFPSDDYYVLLEEGAGSSDLLGKISVAIGRIPVRDSEEAQAVVNKIIRYDTTPDNLRDWRNRLVFVGDDEDTNTHINDADDIANQIASRFPNYNVNKIFLDAYPQVSTPGGDRFPLVTEAINESIFKGTQVITYLGHGGSKGWAQERVLNVSDIISWENADRLPLFVTATCSFTGYDDAGFTTAGEKVFLNEDGGAIALFTTVRAVYANQNATLTEAALDSLFQKKGDEVSTLGEVLQKAKNALASISLVTNSRKFTLIGDPSMRLAVPKYNVVTTKINGIPVEATTEPDTIRALQKVTVEGEIRDGNDQLLTDYNGTLYPTIFDKTVSISTLVQDSGSRPKDFKLQKNVLFKGRASVVNGKFSFTFVVPKDINYTYGYGKISYYTENGQLLDGAGNYQYLIIGGTDPDALADDQGPEVEVYINTEEFVFGGITDENPTLLVKLADDNGINVVGNSIGHDLEGVLDDKTQNTYLLNDFYESELNDYTKGEVRYPLSKLEEGRHAIRVKAWDIANNSAEGYTEFVVASSGKIALKHVLNYPNPFIDNTCFQFEHNLAEVEMDVLIHIFTVSGRLIKTIEERILPAGYILAGNDCIKWDGKDDFGDQLARGVYLYKVNLRTVNTGSTEINGESSFEKLVLLK
ncbi:MAG: type IX secretion system sortase PorU [Bacteroidetes bacterium]|nr:type IX secretion system sortase PorU [Bacteroidota bacterium]